MKPNPSRSWSSGRLTARSRLADAEPVMVPVRAGRRRSDGSVQAEHRGHEVQRRDDQDHRLRAGDVDDQRSEQREAERERGVEGQGEDPVRRQELRRGTSTGIIAASRGCEEDGHRRDEEVQEQDQQQ
jgi:hypothetical protein